MKQKRTYSLTAKERKEKRRAEELKKSGKTPRPASEKTMQTREQAEMAFVAECKRSRSSAIIVGCICAIAVLLIVAALIVPIIMHLINPYRGYDKVVARFNLSNGMVLEYEIEEDTYETAATNFIFLAKNKYFDNTVFYDAQNGWLRFGGYEAQPSTSSSSDYNRTHHHAQNVSYCENFGALDNSRFRRATDKFGYRLRADNGGSNDVLMAQAGILTYRYSDTATEFQFTYEEQARNEIVSLGSGSSGTTQTTYTLSSTMVGRALNDQTLENLRMIAATSKANETITSGYLWRPPTPDIKITTVQVYNLDPAKWKNFDFLNFVNERDKDGNRRLSQWIGVI